jgi:hypothetical protein
MSLPTLIITPAHSSATTNKAKNSLVLQPTRTENGRTISQFQLVEFQDNFTTDYNTTQVFGRMDPIVNYKGTTRKITLGIRTTDLTATNTIKNKMKKLQYPVYEGAPSGITNALAIQRPPLLYITFGDVIHGTSGVGTPLLCAMTGFSNSPRTGLTPIDSPLVVFGANGTSIGFTETTFRFDLIPLHEKTPGFVGDVPEWVGGIL